MKTFALLFSFSFLLQIPATLKGAISTVQTFSKIENRMTGPSRHQTAHTHIKKKHLLKNKLAQVFAKVNSWIEKKEKRRGTKYGLIGLGIGLSSIFLLGIFSHLVFLGFGILVGIGALVFSFINFRKSFKKRERLWPAILMMVAIIPIGIIFLYFIACFNGCF